MKKLFGALFLLLVLCLVSFSQENDSTRLKIYEGYLNQTSQQIEKTKSQLEQLRTLLLQLEGAKQAFQIIINDEKKRLNGTLEKKDEDKK